MVHDRACNNHCTSPFRAKLARKVVGQAYGATASRVACSMRRAELALAKQ
jgi:hypothetical protein